MKATELRACACAPIALSTPQKKQLHPTGGTPNETKQLRDKNEKNPHEVLLYTKLTA
jgi:hypothetical protein